MEKPLVSILIVHWNGEKILEDALNSLKKTKYSNYEIILVDNASSDKSVELVQKKFPYVKIVLNDKNYGFAGGNNIGYWHTKGKYVVLLNNDTEVEENWLDELVDFAEKNPDCGALQPKILSLREKEKFEYSGAAGGYIDKYAYPFMRGRIFDTVEDDKGQYEEIKRLFWGSGCALFIRREVIEKIGLFDDDFFAHQEEIDFCWRMNILGYKIYYIPSSIIYHLGGGTLSKENYFKLYLNHRNNITMFLKNATASDILKYFFIRLILEILSSFNSFNRFKAVFAGLWYNLVNLKKILNKRKKIILLYGKKDEKKKRIKEIKKLIYNKSIVFQYYFRKKKTFKDLDWDINER